jgi:hypothetical protein
MKLKDIEKTNCVILFTDSIRLRKFVVDRNIPVLGGVDDDDRFLCFFATSRPITLDALVESQIDWPRYHHLDIESETKPVAEKEPAITKDSDVVVLFCNIVAILCVYLSKLIIDVHALTNYQKSILMFVCGLIMVVVVIIDIDHFDMLGKVKQKKIINND